MKSIIAGIIDNVLTFLTATFFSIAVAGYFSNDFKVILVSALTCAVCITALTDMFREKRKPLENPRIKEVLTQFIYNDEKFASDYICAALEKKYTVENKGKFILVNGVTAVFVRLKPGRISAKDIAYIYGDARAHAKKTVILSVDGADTGCRSSARPENHRIRRKENFRTSRISRRSARNGNNSQTESPHRFAILPRLHFAAARKAVLFRQSGTSPVLLFYAAIHILYNYGFGLYDFGNNIENQSRRAVEKERLTIHRLFLPSRRHRFRPPRRTARNHRPTFPLLRPSALFWKTF